MPDRSPSARHLCVPARPRHAAAVLAGLILTASFAAAGPPARLTGQVIDAAGRPVPGAEVVARPREAAGLDRRTTADADGRFVLDVTAGPWIVDAQVAGGWRSAPRRVEAAAGTVAISLQLDRPSHAELLVVTAESRPQALDEVAKAVTVIEADEIAARAEFAVAEVIRAAAGVQVRIDGGPGQLASLRLRGLRPDAAAVLIDGLRFRDVTTLQGDATAFLANLHVVNLEKVEVLRGAASSLYGTNAVGGAINLITRSGAAATGGEAQIEGGGLGLVRARGSISGSGVRGRLRYSVGGSHVSMSRGVDGHDGLRADGGQGAVAVDLQPGTTVTARVFGSGDRLDLNVSPSAFAVPAGNLGSTARIPARALHEDRLGAYARGAAVDFNGATFVPGLDDPDDERSSAFVTAALRLAHRRERFGVDARYQRLHTARTFQNGPGGPGFQPAAASRSDFTGDVDTADLTVRFDAGPALLSAGYEFERERYDTRQRQLAAPSGLEVRTTIVQDAHAGFVRAGYRPAARLDLAASLRAQAFRLSRPAFVFTGTTDAYSRASLDVPPSALTGDVAAAYAVSAATKLRVHAGNAYRAPSLYERFGGGFSSDPGSGLVSFSPYGDPRLEPDRYRTIDVGVDQEAWSGRARLHATWFYTRIVQVTEFDFTGGIDPARDPYGRFVGYVNGSGGLARGLEIEGDLRARAFRVRGAYTATSSRTDVDRAVAGVFEAFGVARHTFAATALQQIGPLDLSADLHARSRLSAPFFTPLGSRVYEFPAIARLDVGAGWTWHAGGRRRLRVYARVENLLDREYYEVGWRAPGVTGAVGLRLLQ